TLCYEVSHHHNATRGNRQQGEAALADHQPCLNRPAAGAASSGILARTSFKRSEIRVQRGSGCWAGSRRILIQNTPSTEDNQCAAFLRFHFLSSCSGLRSPSLKPNLYKSISSTSKVDSPRYSSVLRAKAS